MMTSSFQSMPLAWRTWQVHCETSPSTAPTRSRARGSGHKRSAGTSTTTTIRKCSSRQSSHRPGPVRRCCSPVPEPRTVKNRMHVDLQPSDGTREEEVERLLALGATVVEDHRSDDGTGWVWLADPEGNDFCVERSADERKATAGPRTYRVTEAS